MHAYAGRRIAAGVVVLAVAACSPFSSAPDSAVDGGGTDLDGGSREAGVDASPVDAKFDLQCGVPPPCTEVGSGCCYPEIGAPACSPAGSECPPAQVRLLCDDADDCTAMGMQGRVCCGTLVSTGSIYYFQSATCVAPSNCVGPNDVQLCNRNVPGQCGVGKGCTELATYAAPDGGTAPVFPRFSSCAR
jgi:hypothetical protein